MQALKNAYPLVERFVLVYLVGTSVALLAPIFLNFRPPPVLPQVLVAALAAGLGWRAFLKRHGRQPKAAEWLVALFASLVVVVAAQLFVNARRSPESSRQLQHFLTVTGATALGLSFVLGRLGGGTANARDGRAQTPHRKPAVPVADRSAPKIPLSIGFANLATDPASELRRQTDLRMLGPLFQHVLAPRPGEVPSASVLMVYARLQADGTLAGMPHPVGIRQLVQATGAAIVVLAIDNAPEAIQAAASLPGPKTANIVFTLERKGELLPKFLGRLFTDMARGTDMMSAWVKLCPQGPASARDDVPTTLFFAEGGKIAFPAAGAAS